MTQKCINCRKAIEPARIQLLSTSLCSKCAHKFTGHKSQGNYTGTNFFMPIDLPVKAKKVPNSQVVFSVMREDALPRVSTPFKRLRKPTIGVIRDGDLWAMRVPMSRSINGVIDDNATGSNDFSDSSREFDTSVPRSADRNPGD